MNNHLFECALGIHEYAIPDKKHSYILICKYCKKYGYYKNNSNGYESWSEHDDKGNLIYWKDNDGWEGWFCNSRWTTEKPKDWKYE